MRIAYSTTFGTRKKLSSVAGAFAVMSSALLPSVTASARFFISIGVTEVIGSTPRHVDLVQLLDETEDRVQFALHPRRFFVGDGDAGEFGDALDGGKVDGHAILRENVRFRPL
jgi:hypothetical protein